MSSNLVDIETVLREAPNPMDYFLYGYEDEEYKKIIFFMSFREVSNEAAFVKLLQNCRKNPQVFAWVLRNVVTDWKMSYPGIKTQEE